MRRCTTRGRGGLARCLRVFVVVFVVVLGGCVVFCLSSVVWRLSVWCRGVVAGFCLPGVSFFFVAASRLSFFCLNIV